MSTYSMDIASKKLMFDKNPVTRLLTIQYPIIQGGMAWSSTAKLACSVSNAGGLGIIGCAGREIDWVLEQIRYVKQNTKKPVGLNVALNDENALEILEIAAKKGVKFFTMGGANTYLKLIPKFGEDITIIPLVGSVAEAKFAERAGAKMLICEGQESGGSIGRLSLFALLPQVVDAVNIPVIAAGGIADGRGMSAAFALGATGIQMGTRFLACEECNVSDEYKKRILKARDTDSMVISKRINRPTRVIKNKFASDYLSKELSEIKDDELYELARGRLKLAVESDVDAGAMHAGEVAGLIKEVKSARKIIDDTIADYLNINQSSFFEDRPKDVNLEKYLKHQYPLLLVDHVLHLNPGEECTTSLSLTKDRWFFGCHYPDFPVMPGTLLLEAMSQTMVIAITSMDDYVDDSKAGVLLSKISNSRFMGGAFPEMELKIHARIKNIKRGIVSGTIVCESGGVTICSSEQTIVIPTAIGKFLAP